MHRDRFYDLLDMFQKYLTQQRELFGNEVLLGTRGEGVLSKLKGEIMTLEELYQSMRQCQRCGLAATRTNLVFGAGKKDADLILIGEAPGEEEDLQGEPFVGRAGQLLNKILQSIGFQRGDVYIANILKCRPPGNRDPLPEEIRNCEPYLIQQLQIIKPKLILALGRIAAQTLLRTKDPLAKLRGKVHDYQGIKLIVTYHPAALLRYPGLKRPTWEDVQLLRKIYDSKIGGGRVGSYNKKG